MKLTPCSRARATMRRAVGSSVGPPNIIVPRHNGETFSPLRPSLRYSIAISSPARLIVPIRVVIVVARIVGGDDDAAGQRQHHPDRPDHPRHGKPYGLHGQALLRHTSPNRMNAAAMRPLRVGT